MTIPIRERLFFIVPRALFSLEKVGGVFVILTDKNQFEDSVFCDVNSSRASDISKLSHHVSDYGLSLDRRQAIYWTNTGLLEPTVIFQSNRLLFIQ